MSRGQYHRKTITGLNMPVLTEREGSVTFITRFRFVFDIESHLQYLQSFSSLNVI